jgi:hypothetical protein
MTPMVVDTYILADRQLPVCSKQDRGLNRTSDDVICVGFAAAWYGVAASSDRKLCAENLPLGAANCIKLRYSHMETTCSRCGSSMTCGKGQSTCWCADLPHIVPMPEQSAGCLCRTCLQAEIDRLEREARVDGRQLKVKG